MVQISLIVAILNNHLLCRTPLAITLYVCIPINFVRNYSNVQYLEIMDYFIIVLENKMK